MKFQLLAVKSYYKSLSFIAPKVAANKAFMLFQKVRIKTIRKREEEFYLRAKAIEVPNKTTDFQVYELGNPEGKPLLLVHGWDSNIGSMSNFAFNFSKENYKVIAINLPAHGKSKQVHTNMFECKNTVKEVLKHYNFKESISIIAHSFGSGVIAYALSEVNVHVDRLVFLTAANKIDEIFLEFKNFINLGDKSYQMMVQKANELLGENLLELITSEKLLKSNFDKGLIIHDKFDKVLPYRNAETIGYSVKNIEVMPFEKIGHYRMLWNDEVLKATISYIAN